MADKAKQPPGETAPPIRYTVAPGSARKIVMKTQPGAVCTLRAEDEPDQRRKLKFYADQDGMIQFHVRPAKESNDLVKVVVESQVGDKVRRYPLELRVSSKPTTEMPAPALESSRRPVGVSVRPALSEDDILNLSDKELRKRGYPPRPNHEQAPKAFNAWRRSVMMPMTVVEPKIVSNPDISHGSAKIVHGPAYSSNWSGFELRGVGPYAVVVGQWNVPDGTRNSPYVVGWAYSSLWVGLDGDGTADGPIQAGTEQDNLVVGDVTFGNFYPWWEYFPALPEQIWPNWNYVNPGDEIFTEVWIGDSSGNLNSTGGVAWFYMNDVTMGVVAEISYTLPVQPALSEAEWIMERPTLGDGSLPSLMDYISATMGEAWAYSLASGWVTYQGDTNLQITMLNNIDTLSTVTPIDTYSMFFTWDAAN